MRHRQSGFTLIEIMVVVVILAVLGALVVPNILGKVDTARITAAKTDIRSIGTALDLYRLDNFKYPTTEQGLQALVKQPADPTITNYPANGYLKTIPKDPWGNLRVGVAATTKISRKDFGLVWNAPLETGGILIGDEITITLDVQFVKAA